MSDLKNLSIDELLKLAESSTEEVQDEVETNKYVLAFIKENKILPGTILVPNYLIFYMYIKHWRIDSRKKLSKVEFFRNFKKHFEQKRKTNTRYYLLDEGYFDLSEDNLTHAKLSDRIYENKRKKKVKTKRK